MRHAFVLWSSAIFRRNSGFEWHVSARYRWRIGGEKVGFSGLFFIWNAFCFVQGLFQPRRDKNFLFKSTSIIAELNRFLIPAWVWFCLVGNCSSLRQIKFLVKRESKDKDKATLNSSWNFIQNWKVDIFAINLGNFHGSMTCTEKNFNKPRLCHGKRVVLFIVNMNFTCCWFQLRYWQKQRPIIDFRPVESWLSMSLKTGKLFKLQMQQANEAHCVMRTVCFVNSTSSGFNLNDAWRFVCVVWYWAEPNSVVSLDPVGTFLRESLESAGLNAEMEYLL